MQHPFDNFFQCFSGELRTIEGFAEKFGLGDENATLPPTEFTRTCTGLYPIRIYISGNSDVIRDALQDGDLKSQCVNILNRTYTLFVIVLEANSQFQGDGVVKDMITAIVNDIETLLRSHLW